MKIAVFCAYFYPHKGGVETYVKELFSELKGFDVTIITSNTEHSPRFEKRFGMDIYRFDCRHMMGNTFPIIRSTEIENIDRLVREQKFDYIITQTRFFHTSWIGFKVAKKYNIPLIHFEHGTMHSPIKNPLFRFGGTIYDHTIGRQIIKNSYKLIGISHASEQFIKHLYPKAKTTCIYNSIDAKAIKRTSKAKQHKLKNRHGIKDEKVILFVGRMIFAKGAQDLLEAIKPIKDKEHIKTILVGDGNYLDELKKKYPWAIFTGQKEIDDIRGYLSIADIFVNPSYAEGLPTSILEAGAIGVPVIATDVGGTREIIDDGENGFLIKPKEIQILREKMIKLLHEDKLRKRFANSIREKIVKDFDWKKAKKDLAKVLK